MWALIRGGADSITSPQRVGAYSRGAYLRGKLIRGTTKESMMTDRKFAELNL